MSNISSLVQLNTSSTSINFKPNRVVIVSKQSVLEYELNRFRSQLKHEIIDDFSDQKLLSEVEKRLPNLRNLKERHEQQQSYVKSICEELSRHSIEFKVVNRHTYTKEIVDWCDLVISAGGDGTFLTAASKVRNQIPVIGINTDPVGSEGHLCLTGKLNRPADKVIRQFLNNEFRWTHRQRIRVTMVNQRNNEPISPSISSDSSSLFSEKSFANENTQESDKIQISTSNSLKKEDSGFDAVQLSPFKAKRFNFNFDDQGESSIDFVNNVDNFEMSQLALNEVFIGESHAARVSYYDVQLDDGPLMKQKSSGMTICTGTGSTSWHYNINRLTELNLKEILQIVGQMGFAFASKNTTQNLEKVDESILSEICKQFNQKLVFEPNAEKMAFSIRDPVFNATFAKTMTHGFARRIRLQSRCTHAHLILDGSTSISFNRGSEVILEIHPGDALRTAALL